MLVVPSTQSVLARYGLDSSTTTRSLCDDANVLLARWILRERLPFTIVSSDDFKAFLRRLNPHYQLPCRQTVKKRVMVAYGEEKEMIVEYFRRRPDLRPCCILDVWKSTAGDHYVGIVAHFISEEWECWAVTLGVKPIRVAHTSENIKSLVTEVLNEFHIVPQCYVADNCANQVLANDMLADWSNSTAAVLREQQRAVQAESALPTEADNDSDDDNFIETTPDSDFFSMVRYILAWTTSL